MVQLVENGLGLLPLAVSAEYFRDDGHFELLAVEIIP